MSGARLTESEFIRLFPDQAHQLARGASTAPVLDEPAMSEKQLSEKVRRLCRNLGLLAYHPWRSDNSAAGFLDWTIVVGGRVLFRELKSERGKLRPDQRVWIEALEGAGMDVTVWRPSDWTSGQIEKELSQ